MNKPTGVATEREVYKVLGTAWANLHELPWDADNPNPKIELEVKKFLLAVREHTGLFVERAPKRYGFMHLTFEEYYAARCLVARSKARAKLIHQHLHDPRWEEPILLAFGFVGLESSIEAQELLETTIFAEGDEAKALGFTFSLYEDLLGRDYLFALRCLGDNIPVRPVLLQKLVNRLANELLHKKGSARFPRYRQALDESIGQLKGSKGGAALLPVLATALSDPAPDVRARSARCLEHLEQASPEVISALLEKLRRDANAVVRSLGAVSLGRLGLTDPEVITVLVHALDDSSFSVRKEAASSLGVLGQTSPGVIPALLHALHNPEFVRKSIETSLEQLGHVSSEVVTTLINASEDTNTDVRESVIRILGQLSKASPEVVTTLINASRDTIAGVRIAAIDSLGQLGQVSPDVMIILTNALHDADTNICKAAIDSLGQLSKIDPEIVTILINALRDSDSFARQYMARNLGLLGHVSPEIISVLIDALNDVDALVRREATRSLGQLDQVTPDVIDALLLVLCDSNVLVRSVAVESLGKLGQATPKVIDALIRALHESNLLMRCEAARSLGQLGQTSHEVITALLGALCDVHFSVCLEATKSLGRLGQTSPEVVTALLNFLNNADSNISHWVAHSLGLIGQPSSEVVTALLKELDQSNDWSLRHNAAISLGKVSQGDEPTIQALWYGLLDKDKDVRTACAEGLAQLGQRFPEISEEIAKKLVQAIGNPEFDKLDNSKIRAYNYAFDALWLLMHAKTHNRVHEGFKTETQQVFVPELSVDEQGIVGLG